METKEEKKGFKNLWRRIISIKMWILWAGWVILLLITYLYSYMLIENFHQYLEKPEILKKLIWGGFIALSTLLMITLILSIVITLFKSLSKKEDENSS